MCDISSLRVKLVNTIAIHRSSHFCPIFLCKKHERSINTELKLKGNIAPRHVTTFRTQQLTQASSLHSMVRVVRPPFYLNTFILHFKSKDALWCRVYRLQIGKMLPNCKHGLFRGIKLTFTRRLRKITKHLSQHWQPWGLPPDYNCCSTTKLTHPIPLQNPEICRHEHRSSQNTNTKYEIWHINRLTSALLVMLWAAVQGCKCV